MIENTFQRLAINKGNGYHRLQNNFILILEVQVFVSNI